MHGRPVSDEELELIRRMRCEEGRDIPEIIEAVAEQFGHRRTIGAVRGIIGSRRWKLPPDKARELAETRLKNLRRARQRRESSTG